jgi:hypothetical protein
VALAGANVRLRKTRGWAANLGASRRCVEAWRGVCLVEPLLGRRAQGFCAGDMVDTWTADGACPCSEQCTRFACWPAPADAVVCLVSAVRIAIIGLQDDQDRYWHPYVASFVVPMTIGCIILQIRLRRLTRIINYRIPSGWNIRRNP